MFSSKYHEEGGKVRGPAGGGQLGFAAAFSIVCLNQGHFFPKSFFINFYGFSKKNVFKISWVERWGVEEELYRNPNAQINL